MENTGKGSRKSLSPTNKPKSNDASINMSSTQNAHAGVATRIEAGRSSAGGERRKRQSSESIIRIPWQMVELTSGEGIGNKTRSLPMAVSDSNQEPKIEVTDVEDSPKRSAGTIVINHKRKLSQGDEEEVTSEEISKKFSSLNDPATEGNKEKVSDAQKNEVHISIAQKNDMDRAIGFDLNDPPIDEGEEVSKIVKENEDLPPTHRGLQGLNPNHEIKGEEYSSDGLALETTMEPRPTGGVKSEAEHPIIVDINEAKLPSLEDNAAFAITINEMESSSMEENDNGGDARIPKFDLNEVPVDEDAEDQA